MAWPRYWYHTIDAIFETQRSKLEYALPLILFATDDRSGNVFVIVVIQCKCQNCRETTYLQSRQFLVPYYCFTEQEAVDPLALTIERVGEHLEANKLISWKTWEDACVSMLSMIRSEDEDIQEGRAITLRAWLDATTPL